MLAASWLGMVTGRAAYVRDAESYWDRIFNDPNSTSWQGMVSSWDNAWWASNLLLWKQTGKLRYKVILHLLTSSSSGSCCTFVSTAHGNRWTR